MENSLTSLAHNSVLAGPIDFKFGTELCYMILQATPQFGGN